MKITVAKLKKAGYKLWFGDESATHYHKVLKTGKKISISHMHSHKPPYFWVCICIHHVDITTMEQLEKIESFIKELTS